jgi:hypothetical protein
MPPTFWRLFFMQQSNPNEYLLLSAMASITFVGVLKP